MTAAVRAGADSIEHVTLLDEEVVAEMLARGTYLVPTIHVTTSFDVEKVKDPELRPRRRPHRRRRPRASLPRRAAAGLTGDCSRCNAVS